MESSERAGAILRDLTPTDALHLAAEMARRGLHDLNPYEDAEHGYRQTKSFAFSKAGKRFEDWSFPVISEKVGAGATITSSTGSRTASAL